MPGDDSTIEAMMLPFSPICSRREIFMSLPDHHHHFARVEDYLHHRAPYLMVSGIDEIGDRSIQTTTHVSEDMDFLRGHFPGAPIVPGAMLQEVTTQSAGILLAARFNPMEQFNTHDPFFNQYALGVLIRVKGARFRGFVRPGDVLTTEVELIERVEDIFDFQGRILNRGKVVMSNCFQLANILSSTLQGNAPRAASQASA
jgi:3-hydroxyacyl-[acyl-carrier-protein] dehydratase